MIGRARGMEDIGFGDELLNTASAVDGDAWFADLLFWRPSKLSDEAMRLHFCDYDGRWSSQTQAAVQRFCADGLDLNENWALTSPTWSCLSISSQN